MVSTNRMSVKFYNTPVCATVTVSDATVFSSDSSRWSPTNWLFGSDRSPCPSLQLHNSTSIEVRATSNSSDGQQWAAIQKQRKSSYSTDMTSAIRRRTDLLPAMQWLQSPSSRSSIGKMISARGGKCVVLGQIILSQDAGPAWWDSTRNWAVFEMDPIMWIQTCDGSGRIDPLWPTPHGGQGRSNWFLEILAIGRVDLKKR